MAVLTLDYRCCNRKLPLYIKHAEVERIAATARQQLVVDSIDSVSFDALRQISGLKINGIDFALEVSTVDFHAKLTHHFHRILTHPGS
ncbi:hypothetical protein [Alicycliphilus denitrificans]|uniref:Uncharacterized protein n=1 Tax=Alicycliphilus denitrificans (strain DSM 14773 / CIP 107495 / K601) TaxID=596154 RepID=F4G8T9_ALIDK|nr:hypothetical protein [Alicycliphilus denitrificans]ADU99614.1 hypothetical protein Alide_1868 [Alicycliphilus denitrificans BC]AEB84448.1 hypothetical protein Alide2_2074 [Alicycliphilus denitrificans K601]GAO23736.1 hypothetical protein ALISP_3556 [Alicycliphilus sp. B1]